MVSVEDKIEVNRKFLTDSLSTHKMSDMSLTDFSKWYSERWEKDAKYIGHEEFLQKIIIKFGSLDADKINPIYPWKEQILKEILTNTITERKETIKLLLKRIEELESRLKKRSIDEKD